ncbi:MAG: ABC transporter permease, partial [Flavobacteriales bacterium]
KRILYTPLNPNSILYGKMLSNLTMSILQLLVMFIFSWLVFGLNIFTDVLSLIIMILASAFACSAFGIFLASVAKSRKQVQGLSTVIILLMSAIGGSMVPLFIMPDIMSKIAVFSVNYWALQGFFDIFWREMSMLHILSRAGVLFGMGLIITTLAFRFYRSNILKLV